MAKRRLSNALWQIRSTAKRVAGDELAPRRGLIVASSSDLQLNPELEVELDAEQFESVLNEIENRYRGGWSRAVIDELTELVGSYKGDLLPGHGDPWIDDHRSRVKERYHNALAQLVRLSTGAGDYDAALRHARAQVADDPLGEEWHRSVIRLCALIGQSTAAERQFEACRAVLLDNLGTEPAAETVELIERIRNDAGNQPLVVAESTTRAAALLPGRAAERASLLSPVNKLVGGTGGVMLVEGDDGVGKTSLVDELAKGAEWRGVQVLAGRHTAASPSIAYSALREALAPVTGGLRGERLEAQLESLWLDEASAVLGQLTSNGGSGNAHAASWTDPDRSGTVDRGLRPEEQPARLTEALVRVILAQGQPKPTLLILDDVHWCDEATLRVLVQVADRLAGNRVLICLIYERHEAQRSPGVWLAISELEAKPGASRHVISPLGVADVRQLLASELGADRHVSDTVVESLASATSGNPEMILELVKGGFDFSSPASFELPVPGQPWRQPVRPGASGMLLVDALTRRVATAPGKVQTMLGAVSTMTGPTTAGLVSLATGLDRAEAITALSEAVDLGFLVELAQGCWFAHELTRRAVYERLAPETRTAIHGRLSDAPAGAHGLPVEELARHAWLGERWEWAHEFHRLAADAALDVDAHQLAAEHLTTADRAATRAGIDDRLRVDDLLGLEQVLDLVGERAEQEQVLDRLATVVDLVDLPGEVDLAVRQRRAWFLVHTDRAAQAIQVATDALDVASNCGQDPGDLLTIIGFARAWSGDLSGAVEPLEQAINGSSNGSGDGKDDGNGAGQWAGSAAGLQAQLLLGRTYLDLGQFGPAERHLMEALSQAKAGRDARSQVEALGHLGALHRLQGDGARAETDVQEGLELASKIGYRLGEGRNLLALATIYTERGQSGKALSMYDEALLVVTSLGSRRDEAIVRAERAKVLYLIVGDHGTARSEAVAASVQFRQLGDDRNEAACLVTLARIDRLEGGRRLARRRVTAARDKARDSGDQVSEILALLTQAMIEYDLGHDANVVDLVHDALSLTPDPWPAAAPVIEPALLAIDARALVRLGHRGEAANRVDKSISAERPGTAFAHLVAWWRAEVLMTLGQHGPAGRQVDLAYQRLSKELADLPESVLASVPDPWTSVAEHRSIAEARQMYRVDTTTRRLPRRTGSNGRVHGNRGENGVESAAPVVAADAAVDLIDVRWTVSEPEDWSVPSPAARRQRRVRRLVAQAAEQGGTVRVADLAEALDVSERTIKRDLAQLRAEGIDL